MKEEIHFKVCNPFKEENEAFQDKKIGLGMQDVYNMITQEGLKKGSEDY
jgi:hypothetical protein